MFFFFFFPAILTNKKKKAPPRYDDGIARRLVLCQIAVGRSFVVEDESMLQSSPLPKGFDSVFVSSPTLEQITNADGVDVGAASFYRHEYVLFDTNQVLPMYLIQYFPGPPGEESSIPKAIEVVK